MSCLPLSSHTLSINPKPSPRPKQTPKPSLPASYPTSTSCSKGWTLLKWKVPYYPTDVMWAQSKNQPLQNLGAQLCVKC
ncbi:hypothetical protein CMV_011152 [Castanea mollissima]|uniref:Uncharacterized protein n=1 Tax=Castanea mollissima TaxID=60419 RepID=A0A8J4R2M9_9ROSI|nr:hypothetical protein CMV_011152 [Castanea mollissima]